ncbi:aminotransferase class IV-domain-containing protein [Cercophora newfieldiana]|uniref:Aminotransferase class IV-domain-containing protein n=1 Tax=Cercophora newfieldiana TaxID=92897 RepID=A0AA40CMI2_9PEZI|nr:aminotransferase class IV-domain-containing protein [Cercophora newfieldiana]
MATSMQRREDQQDLQSIISAPEFEIITTMCYSRTLPASPSFSSSTTNGTDDASQSNPEITACYLLSFGLDRLRAAASALSWPDALATLCAADRLSTVACEIGNHIRTTHDKDLLNPAQRFIVRLALRHSGAMTIHSAPRPTTAAMYFPTTLPPPSSHATDGVPTVALYIDPGFTPKSQLTTHKTTYRDDYNAARRRVGLHESTPFTEGEVLLTNSEGEVMGGCFSTVYFWREERWVTPRAESGCKLGVSRRWAVERAGVQERAVRKEEFKLGHVEVVWLSSAVGGFCWGMLQVLL